MNKEEFQKAYVEYQRMPEHNIIRKLRSLDVSRYVYDKNYQQLVKLLRAYEDPKNALEIWSDENRAIQDRFHLEVTRLLHNFVASAKSLVEHTRRTYRDLNESDGTFSDYQAEVNKSFSTNPLVRFVEGLRTYCLHFSQPNIFSSMSWAAESGQLESEFRINVEALRLFRGWSSFAKIYLDSQHDDIYILALVENYNEIVVGFHTWFTGRQAQIHSTALNRLEEKRKLLGSVIIPSMLGMRLPKDKGEITDPDRPFLFLLTIEERKELRSIPLTSPGHAKRLLTMIEKRVPVSQELKGRISSIFRKFEKQ